LGKKAVDNYSWRWLGYTYDIHIHIHMIYIYTFMRRLWVWYFFLFRCRFLTRWGISSRIRMVHNLQVNFEEILIFINY